ncbi:MAG: DUF3488 and DUF4129 domain-containing transglutaminase family protein [Snowella sp.]|nr:DUF3488 and DUF4129 domain-containing transglutaminase family protein [Snowella sp.]
MANTVSRKSRWLDQIQERIDSIPQAKTEESIIFRILVQALVIVGIIATDIAAQTEWSIWAVPLSIVGAIFSWYRRKERNIALKFALAIGMLGVLFIFLSNLVVNLNDSRIALAGLLVQLQVLHSFDLPRRKDLGYSMVIGLILLGVAGTVSQTMIFAVWLFLFLAIALPTLALDYRSRLGLESIDQQLAWFSHQAQKVGKSVKSQSVYKAVYPKRLAVILGITLALGLVIFAIMPRFPSYQLQTFPVSSPTDLQNKEFDENNQNVSNPGYVKEGEESTEGQGGRGNSPLKGAGEMDDTFYYGFNSRINQNLRGGMKQRLVLRIRSQAPGFWRALSFDRYTGQGWEITGDQNISKIRRSPWSYRFDLPLDTGFAKTKRIIQTYTAVTELPNVIPNLASPKSIYFPTREIGLDQNGILRSPVGLLEGLTYTVISEVPYRDRSVLRQAPYEYSKAIKQRYLQIPPEINEKVRQKTLELLSKAPQPINSVYEAALFLTQALKQNYTIQTDLPYFGPDEDLVEAFLFKYGGGYPDHFSTVLTVMLRSIGIPARLTAGFAPGQFNPFTGYYLVHNTDAYVLTEVYFPYFGWFAFDPIPGHELFPPSFEDEETFSVLKQIWNWVAGWLPSPVTNFISLFWTNVIQSLIGFLGWLWRFVSGSLLGAILGLIGAISVGFMGWLGWEQARNWLYRRRLAKLPPMSRLYQQLLKLLRAQGYPKDFAQTPKEYVESLRDQLSAERLEIIEEISLAYGNWRYGEQPANIEYLEQRLKALIRSMEREKSFQFLSKSSSRP